MAKTQTDILCSSIKNSLISLKGSLANSLLLPGPLYRRIWFESRSAYQLRKYSAQVIPYPKTAAERRANRYNESMARLYHKLVELEAQNMIQECTCRDCTKRKVGCHGHCKEYLAWKKAYEKERKRIQARIHDEQIYEDDYHTARSRRRRKGR